MAAKRRKIIAQDFNRGFGATTIPTDSGGSRAASKIGIHTLLGDAVLSAADFPGASAGELINFAIAALPVTGGFIDARSLIGTQEITSSVEVPARTTLQLGAATFNAVAGLVVTVATAGASGRVIGSGPSTKIVYTGSGYAISASAAGATATDLLIADLMIEGTASGAAGIYMSGFNGGSMRAVTVFGFTNGAGILNEGSNKVDYFYPILYGNRDGLRNVGKLIGVIPSAPNACCVYGGEFHDNSRWGVFEDASGTGGGVGPNIGNAYFGSVFETNGTGAGPNGGQAFMQGSQSGKFYGCYMEYGTSQPDHHITIGDASHAVKGTQVIGCSFAGGSGLAHIGNLNGISTFVEGCENFGGDFFYNGHASRIPVIGKNNHGSGTVFFGFDDASDVDLYGGPVAVVVNQHGPTATGYGHTYLSGYLQDLKIREAVSGSGLAICIFQQLDGTPVASVNHDGGFATPILRITEGSNASQGVATLIAGAKTVLTTRATATCRVDAFGQADNGGTPGWLRCTNINPDISFTITSSNVADTSIFMWRITEPA